MSVGIALDHLLPYDEPAVWARFSEALAPDSSIRTSDLRIGGLRCAACAPTLERSIRATAGVLDVFVSGASRRARVVWDSQVTSPSKWLAAVEGAGYKAWPGNEMHADSAQRTAKRHQLWQLLVAGFCMMQVMMYAVPVYMAQPGEIDARTQALLRWASWSMAVPVLFFSSQPFFSAAWVGLKQRQISMDLPVALGIAVAFVVSTAGTFDPSGAFGQEVFFDSMTMFVFFLLFGRWLELKARIKTTGALDALCGDLTPTVERQRPDGRFESVLTEFVRVGDKIKVKAGEVFVADAEIEFGETEVSEALLTGESRPIHKSLGGIVMAGSHNLRSTVVVRALRIADQTFFSQIARLMRSATLSKPHATRAIDRLATPFLLCVLAAAAAAFAWWWPQDPGHAAMVAVAVLIVTCPCALSLATPAASLAAAGALAKSGVLIRDVGLLEKLTSIDTVLFDKTGTLTDGDLQLIDSRFRQGADQTLVLAMAQSLASDSLHPVSKALVRWAGGASTATHGRLTSSSENGGQGVSGVWLNRDSGESVSLKLGSAHFCGFADEGGQGTRSYLSDESGFLARFDFQEVLRNDAQAVVIELKAQGLHVGIISGDRAPAVDAIACQLGIELRHADCLPEGKLSFLLQLRQSGARVLMIGDGINDAPVLAAADASISFSNGSPLAMSRADAVLMGNSLRGVAQLLVTAKHTKLIVTQNILWAVAYNAVCVPLAVAGCLPAWLAGLGMAASSLFVVANALRLSSVTPFDAKT